MRIAVPHPQTVHAKRARVPQVGIEGGGFAHVCTCTCEDVSIRKLVIVIGQIYFFRVVLASSLCLGMHPHFLNVTV